MDNDALDRARLLRALPEGNVVRVVVPVEVAFNLEQIQEVQRTILDRLGCRACCSGFDIRYELEREFVVDQELNVQGRRPQST